MGDRFELAPINVAFTSGQRGRRAPGSMHAVRRLLFRLQRRRQDDDADDVPARRLAPRCEDLHRGVGSLPRTVRARNGSSTSSSSASVVNASTAATLFVTRRPRRAGGRHLGSTEILLRSGPRRACAVGSAGQRFTGNGDVLGFATTATTRSTASGWVTASRIGIRRALYPGLIDLRDTATWRRAGGRGRRDSRRPGLRDAGRAHRRHTLPRRSHADHSTRTAPLAADRRDRLAGGRVPSSARWIEDAHVPRDGPRPRGRTLHLDDDRSCAWPGAAPAWKRHVRRNRRPAGPDHGGARRPVRA